MAIGKIEVELVIDDTGFTQTIKKAGVTISQVNAQLHQLNATMGNETPKAVNSLTSGFRGLVLDINLVSHAIQQAQQFFGSWFGSMIEASAAFEKSNVMMQGLSRATDSTARALEAATTTQYLMQMSMSNPFGIKALQDAYVKLKSVGIDPTDGAIARMTGTMGDMANQSRDSTVNMQGLLDAVATFGGTSDELNRASLAIQQMMGKGVISMEELRRQLGEAVPNAVQVMARSVGMTYAELVKYVSQGKMLAKPAITRMFEQMELEMGGASERMMETWDGLMSHLKSKLTLFSIQAGQTGYFESLKEQIRQLIDWLGSPAGTEAARNFGNMLSYITSTVITLTKFIVEHRTILLTLASAYIGLKVVSGVTAMLQGFAMAMVRGSAPIMTLTANLALARAELAKTSAGMVTAGAAATGMGAGIRTAAAAMTALAGPIGIVVSVLAMATMAWDAYDDAQKAALKTFEDMDGKIADPAMLKVAEDAIAMEEKKIAVQKKQSDELKAQYDRRMKMEKSVREAVEKYDGETTESIKARYDFVLRAMKSSEDKITELRRQQANTREAISDKEAARMSDWASKDLADSTKAIQDKYAKLRDGLERESLSMEERNKKGIEITNAQYQEQIGALEAFKNKMMSLAANDLNPKNDNSNGKISIPGYGEIEFGAFKKAMKDVETQIATIKEKMKANSAFDQSSLIVGGKAVAGLKAYRTEIINNIEKTEELRQKMKGFSDAEAKAAGTIAGEKFKAMAKDTEYTAEKLRDTAKALGEVQTQMDAYIKKQKEITDLNEFATDAMRRLDVELVEMQKRMGNPEAFDKLSSNMRTLMKELEHAKTLGPQAADAMAKLQEAIKKQSAVDLAKDIDKLIDKSKEWNESVLEARYARSLAFQEDMEEIKMIERTLIESGQMTEEASERLAEARNARINKYKNDSMSDLEKLGKEWNDTMENMNKATVNWANSGMDAIMRFVTEGRGNFKAFADAVIADLARIMIQKALAGVVGSIGSAFSGWMNSSVNNGGMTILPADAGAPIVVDAAPDYFATGGVMTSMGPANLRKYANGGIADSPQLAMYGEGSTPEAFVPLPDGRSIPVTVESKGSGQAAPAVNVNVINQSGNDVDAAQGGGMKFDGKQYILDVVLTASKTPGRFRDAMGKR